MECSIVSPEECINEIHPDVLTGRIVFARNFGKKKKYSLENSKQTAKIARLAFGVEDVNFTMARFSGLPYYLNFQSTKCIFIRLRHKNHQEKIVIDKARSKGFPAPSGWYNDGLADVFFWLFQEPLVQNEFSIAFLLQRQLSSFFSELKPLESNSNINSLLPFFSTKNSATGSYAGVPSLNYKKYENKLIEDILLRNIIPSEISKFELHWRALQELNILWSYRLLSITTSVEDWLLFFGVSLSYFCDNSQLKNELRAIAVSLLNSNKIQNKYLELIEELSTKTYGTCISIRGININTDNPDWFTTVNGLLNITEDEKQELKLCVISGDAGLRGFGKTDLPEVQPVGMFDFLPIERLFFKEVA